MCSFLFAILFYVITNPHGYLSVPAAAKGAQFLSVHDAKWVVITLCIAVNTGANLFGIGTSKPASASKAVMISSPSAPQAKAVAAAESTASAPVQAPTETPKPLSDDDEVFAFAQQRARLRAIKRAASGRKAK